MGEDSPLVLLGECLAVHVVCGHRSACNELLRTLIEVNPASLRHEDKKGNLPIHRYAARCSDCLLCPSELISTYPEGLKSKTNAPNVCKPSDKKFVVAMDRFNLLHSVGIHLCPQGGAQYK